MRREPQRQSSRKGLTEDSTFQAELRWLAWEITPRCNLNCIHCRSASSQNVPEGIFTFERAIQLLDHLKEFSSPVIVLTGGEPLLREDLAEIMSAGTDRGFRMCLATNGTLLDDRWCKLLKQAGVKIVSLSLDGPTEKVHDDFRRQSGAFSGTLRGIEYLKKHKIPFLINSSFTARNVSTVKETYELAKSLGARAWYMFMVVPVGRAKEITAELIDPKTYKEVLSWHLEMEKKEEEMLVRPTCAPQYYRLLDEAEEKGESLKRRSLSLSTGGAKGCVAGQTIAMLNAYGEVRPCSYFPLSAGNILHKSFKEIWYESELFKRLRDPKSYGGVCGICPHLKTCGGCRVRAYYGLGNYMGQDPICLPAFGSPL